MPGAPAGGDGTGAAKAHIRRQIASGSASDTTYVPSDRPGRRSARAVSSRATSSAVRAGRDGDGAHRRSWSEARAWRAAQPDGTSVSNARRTVRQSRQRLGAAVARPGWPPSAETEAARHVADDASGGRQPEVDSRRARRAQQERGEGPVLADGGIGDRHAAPVPGEQAHPRAPAREGDGDRPERKVDAAVADHPGRPQPCDRPGIGAAAAA